jgi:PAS domain S-box-containing protein
VRIRTQFIATVVLFAMILVVVGVSLVFTHRQAKHLQEQEYIAHALELGARELSYLFNDFLLHGERQQRLRWETKFSSFSQLLANFSTEEPEFANLILEIKANQERLHTIFAEVASTLGNGPPAGNHADYLAMIRIMWSRMEVQGQGIAFNASQIDRMLEEQGNRLQQRRVILLFALIGVFGAFLIISFVTVNRRILVALADLQEKTRIIGSGNLHLVLEEKKTDEIGDLSRAFNRMTANLRTVTASKADLEQEIRERRQVEEALRGSEAKYRNLFENMTEEVHFWQVVRDESNSIRTWRLVDANPPTLQSWGKMTIEEIRGKTTDEIFGPGAMEHYLPIVEKIMDQGIPHSFEDYFPHLDKYFRFTSVPLGDHFITTGADITVIKKTEERLRLALAKAEEGDRLLSALMEHLPEGITMVDVEFNVTRVSRYGQELLGNAEKDKITADKTAKKEIFHADGRTPMAFADLPLVRAVRAGEVVKDTEIVQISERGVRLPLLCNAGPIRDAEGRVIGGIVAWRDITDHKRTEEALRQSNQELQQFAYAASHDLQEPLRAIIGFLQLIQGKYSDHVDEKGRHYIERTVKAGKRMQEMIRDLLDLSRVSNTGSKFVPVDLNQVVQEIREDLQTIIQEKKADIVSADLPKLEVDPSQMRSLFQNLILNGLRYNENPTPVIEIGSSVHDDVCRIFVRDNGIGIPPKFHQRIFMVFQRLHTDREYAGTGMGLALCKKIVERHGGTIWVESQAGEGATFYFTLPRGR